MKKENVLNKKFTKGFTLIELLVVVLIIGILAAIALPQYKKVVLKSRFAAIKDMTHAIHDAQQRYYSAHDSYTKKWSDLDIEQPTIDCDISFIYSICSLRDKKDNYLLRYIINKETGQRRCDAYSLNRKDLVSKICQEETGKKTADLGPIDHSVYFYN